MLDWIYPQTVSVVNSSYSGKIKVLKSRGKHSIWVGGFEQSGNKYVEGVWRKALSKIALERCNNVLILGLGCGTVVPLILKKWPKAKTVGVEIDPIMIDLGKKYFGLGKISALTIIQADAKNFLEKNTQMFDLILLDCYIANKKIVLSNTKKYLRKNGAIITNNLVGLKSNIVIELHSRNV